MPLPPGTGRETDPRGSRPPVTMGNAVRTIEAHPSRVLRRLSAAHALLAIERGGRRHDAPNRRPAIGCSPLLSLDACW